MILKILDREFEVDDVDNFRIEFSENGLTTIVEKTTGNDFLNFFQKNMSDGDTFSAHIYEDGTGDCNRGDGLKKYPASSLISISWRFHPMYNIVSINNQIKEYKRSSQEEGHSR